MRVALLRAVKAVFSVTGARDEVTERRASLLMWSAAIVAITLSAGGLTINWGPANYHTWVTELVGIPATAAVFLLARRGRADAAAWLFTAVAFGIIVEVAWFEGPDCVRMSAALLAVVSVSSVVSTRVIALFGLGLLIVITGVAAAQSAGIYHPVDVAPGAEAPDAPFIRQSLAVGLMVILLRRAYERLQAQISERERARSAAVDAALAINGSLASLVAERTRTLAATRDRLSGLAAQLAADLAGSLGAMRQRLGDIATAESALPSDQLRYLAKAGAAAERLSVLTGRLHDHACAGTAALRPERIDMDALVRELVDDYTRAAATPIEWRIDSLPPAWGDAALIRTVVENLIGNAVKFSRNRRPPKIEIRCDAERGYFVRDNGVGFDPRHADHLFSPFHRLHAERDFEGNGLGLANVRRILQRSDGEITAESELDHGATFFFRLPGADRAGS